jgi:hypothetical protein
MEVQIATTTPSAASSAARRSHGRRITWKPERRPTFSWVSQDYTARVCPVPPCPMMAAMSDWSSALERRFKERTAQVAVV